MSKEDGKLGSLLARLTEADWDRFRLFLNSPYFNRSQPVKALAEIYEASIVSKGQMLPDTTIFEQIFPEESFDATKMKNLRAALQRKLDQFFSQSAFEKDELLQQVLRLRKLNSMSEDHYFGAYMKKARSLVEEGTYDEEHRQLLLYYLADEESDARARQPDRSQSDGQSTIAFRHAWQFFQIQTLRHLIKQINASSITGQAHDDTKDAERILQLIPADDNALLQIRFYRLALEVLRNKDNAAPCDDLIELLRTHGDKLHRLTQLECYVIAHNACTYRQIKGFPGIDPILVQLFKDMDEKSLLLVNGRLPATMLKTILILGFRAGEAEWVKDFFHRYGKLLDHDPYGNAENLFHGLLYYYEGDLENAERHLNRILDRFEDVFYGLDTRSMLLRIYYESGNFRGLESLAESFKMYIKRHRHLGKARLTSYLRTVNFFRRLIRVNPWDKHALSKLQAEIKAASFGWSSKSWLLQKVEQLLVKANY